MKLAALLFIVINLAIMSCEQKNKKENENTEVKTTTITLREDVEAVEPPPPPPPGTSSSSKPSPWHSVGEWLTAITKKKAPELSIDSYNIGLFESKDAYTLVLTGENKYQKTAYHTVRKLDFKPEHMFFKLPKEYNTLSSDEVKERLSKEIDAFTKTSQFKNSFLSKGKQIRTDWNNHTWPN